MSKICSRRHIHCFLMFPRKQDLTFHTNCFHWSEFARKAKFCFLWKKREKNITNLSSAELAKRVVKADLSKYRNNFPASYIYLITILLSIIWLWHSIYKEKKWKRIHEKAIWLMFYASNFEEGDGACCLCHARMIVRAAVRNPLGAFCLHN